VSSSNAPYIALAVVLAGAAAFAVARRDEAPAHDVSASAPAAPEPPAPADPHGTMSPPGDPHGAAGLPADHPPIGPDDKVLPDEEEPAVTWKVPEAWKTMPNPSPMRIATYRVPRASGDADDADVSVTRAGGGTEANIERWLGQFDDAGQDKRSQKTVRGLKVTIVEVAGTFLGGGMMGAAPAPKKGWALLGAIVETPGAPYFFKLTGPSASVRAARPAFDALVASITPAGG
jgi:hypothetical protein